MWLTGSMVGDPLDSSTVTVKVISVERLSSVVARSPSKPASVTVTVIQPSSVAPILGVEPGMDMEVLVLTLIVVVVGGPGSLKGALVGALLIGFVDSFGKVYIPQLAQIIIYAVMALTLLFKPDGLYKR